MKQYIIIALCILAGKYVDIPVWFNILFGISAYWAVDQLRRVQEEKNMFRDKIREILELVLKAEEKNIYVAYNYDTNTKALTIITNAKVFAFEDNEYMEEWSEECIQYLKNLIGERTE